MNNKRIDRLLPALLVLSLVLQIVAPVGLAWAVPANSPQQQGGPGLSPGEGWSGPIAGISTDPGKLALESGSVSGTNPTQQDYLNAYEQAKLLLDSGVAFRSRELQRLDPATCVANPSDPNGEACKFSITGIANNYLDFNDGRLYWRFCADYDETFVGVGSVAQEVDDPGNKLQIDAFGYCPAWNTLDAAQTTRRVADLQNPKIDIRNQLIDAIRIYAVLAVAEPANMTLPGVDEVTVLPSGALAPGPDQQPDRARDVGIFHMLQATREVANAHMIFGNEFMVKALRFPFSVNDLSSENIVKNEQQQLLRALRQYALATEILLFTLNYDLGGAKPNYVADHFTDQEFQLFAAASQQTVTALTEIAKRDRLLGTNSQVGDQAAIQRLNESFLDQYLVGSALSCQATALGEDDPNTTTVDESTLKFLNNGGYEIVNNLRRLVQQTENIRAGLNPFGYEETFVPLKSFPNLLELTCGGSTVCVGSSGLLASAQNAGNDLRDSQRTFDEKYNKLMDELTELEYDYDRDLTEICGASTDKDGDALKDFDQCGPEDRDGDGEYDLVPNSGLMAQNYFDLVAASDRVSLAMRRAENIVAQIRIEDERAGQVSCVTLGTANTISAYQLAIGKLNAMRTTDTKATEQSHAGYFDASAGVEYENKTTVSNSLNPFACILASCDIKNEQSISVKLGATGGYRFESTSLSGSETVWDPNEEKIAGYESLIALKEAEKEAKIEGANSAAEIKKLLLEQSELLLEYQIAMAEFNRVAVEHNLLVEQYLLIMTQRNGARDWIHTGSPLSKPYFRLFRDGAALEAARTLDQATQAAYLTAKAYEYATLSSVPYLYELYRVRNPSNLRAFLDKLATDYQAIPTEQFSKRTYRLSLAQDIFGLTDQNLNPDGRLTQTEVEALRTQEFQAILRRNRYTVPENQVDKVAFAFSTSINHPKFLKGVFNDRIARISTNDPGCASGCRGVWLNLVTEQAATDFQGDLPQVKLSHGGHATYRNGSLQEASYSPGLAVMIGRGLPPGFGGDTRSAVMTTHLNLPLDVNPDPNKQEDRYYNLSIATSQWVLEIDLTNPTENTQLDLDQINDIEIRMDTTYVTPSRHAQVVAASNRILDAVEAGEVPTAEDQVLLEAYTQTEATERKAALAQKEASTLSRTATLGFASPQVEEGVPYFGAIAITSPVALGMVDMGLTLKIGADGVVTGNLCDGCGPVYNRPAALTGTYNSATKAISFQTAPFTRAVGTRLAQRVIRFEGAVTKEGNLDGSYTETLTGYTARPCVTKGEFLISPLVGNDAPLAEPNRAPTAQKDNLKVLPDSTNNILDVRANDTDPDGDTLTITSVGNPLHGVVTTDGQKVTYTPTADFTGTDTFVYTVSDGKSFAVATVVIGVGEGQGNTVPVAVHDTVTTDAGIAITFNVVANDADADGDELTVTEVSTPQHGTTTTDGKSITYTPNTGFTGTDTFTYIVADGKGGTATGTVTVTVTGGDPGSSHSLYLPIVQR